MPESGSVGKVAMPSIYSIDKRLTNEWGNSFSTASITSGDIAVTFQEALQPGLPRGRLPRRGLARAVPRQVDARRHQERRGRLPRARVMAAEPDVRSARAPRLSLSRRLITTTTVTAPHSHEREP